MSRQLIGPCRFVGHAAKGHGYLRRDDGYLIAFSRSDKSGDWSYQLEHDDIEDVLKEDGGFSSRERAIDQAVRAAEKHASENYSKADVVDLNEFIKELHRRVYAFEAKAIHRGNRHLCFSKQEWEDAWAKAQSSAGKESA